MVFEGINKGVKVFVEKLDCFGVEGEDRAGGQDGRGKKGNINGEAKVVLERLVTFLYDDGLTVASNEEKEEQSLVVKSRLRFLV